jgi:processive 1,2-diacylglycerol beta-glucosyltransferase
MTEKVLIVSASVGSGHTQAANAVRSEFTRVNPRTEVTVVDFLDDNRSYMNSLIKETYFKMIDVFPNMYDFLYRWSQVPLPGEKVQTLMALAMKANMRRLYEKYRPDVIVLTHPFPCCAAAYLRRTRQINVPLAAVMTDFAVHNLWLYPEIDLYFVATSKMSKQLIWKGIATNKVNVTGIPIAASFGEAIKERLAPPKEAVVLVMGGGLGLGAVEQGVRQLAKAAIPLKIVVLTGQNTGLQEKLQSLAKEIPHRLEVMGYTDKVAEIMAQANLLITKPGALTCSEALAMGLPMMLLDPIPGQEEENARYLTSRGAAIKVGSSQHIAEVVTNLLADKQRLDEIRSNASQLGRADAAHRVVNKISAYVADENKWSSAG